MLENYRQSPFYCLHQFSPSPCYRLDHGNENRLDTKQRVWLLVTILGKRRCVERGFCFSHSGKCQVCCFQLKSGMRRENLSLTKWWWWCRSCAAHCHTRGISAEAEVAGRGDTRGWPLNIGKTIAAGNTHTSLLDRCYVVNVFVSTTVAFFSTARPAGWCGHDTIISSFY